MTNFDPVMAVEALVVVDELAVVKGDVEIMAEMVGKHKLLWLQSRYGLLETLTIYCGWLLLVLQITSNNGSLPNSNNRGLNNGSRNVTHWASAMTASCPQTGENLHDGSEVILGFSSTEWTDLIGQLSGFQQ